MEDSEAVYSDVLRLDKPFRTCLGRFLRRDSACLCGCMSVFVCSLVGGHCSSFQHEQTNKLINCDSTKICRGVCEHVRVCVVTDVHPVAGRTALHQLHVLNDSDGQQAVSLIIQYILIYFFFLCSSPTPFLSTYLFLSLSLSALMTVEII